MVKEPSLYDCDFLEFIEAFLVAKHMWSIFVNVRAC